MSNSVNYLLTTDDAGEEQITVFLASTATPLAITCDHPNFEKVREELRAGKVSEPQLIDLIDLAEIASKKFTSLSDRVKVANGRVYFDGDEVHSAIGDHIVRCVEAELEDWKPLVAFLEKVNQNPSIHSREQLYNWLADRDFSILVDGDFIAYKGVTKNKDGEFVSINHGPAVVNNEEVNGAVPNPVGAIVEMPRSQVQFAPEEGCAFGLHVGTYSYAKNFGRGELLKVRVNPRDVVSVPTDCDHEKMRVCRYQVISQIDAPEVAPIDYKDTEKVIEEARADIEAMAAARLRLNACSRDYLRKEASRLGVLNYSRLRKSDLVTLLAEIEQDRAELSKLTRDDLRTMAKTLGLTGYGKMTKAELIELCSGN